MQKKNQTRIRKEFKTGSSHVATRLYTSSRPFLPLLGDYSRRCEGKYEFYNIRGEWASTARPLLPRCQYTSDCAEHHGVATSEDPPWLKFVRP
eukprot:scaffold1913_cov111-Isochrysis_galbana.AAC.2